MSTRRIGILALIFVAWMFSATILIEVAFIGLGVDTGEDTPGRAVVATLVWAAAIGGTVWYAKTHPERRRRSP